MLTDNERQYLEKIPTNKRVVVTPYDPKTPEIVEKFIKKIKKVEPTLELAHLGASALGISGQGDIDLSILCPKDSFSKHRTNLIIVLGDPVTGISLTQWHFEEGGHEVEIYLADPAEESTARQIEVHDILSNNSKLLKEYENLKETAASGSYREYQCQKYEFYNRILEQKL